MSAAPAGIKFAAGLLLALGAAVFGAGAPHSPPRQAPQAERQTGRDLYGDPLPPGAVTRLGTVRLRHADGRVLGFSADGRELTSAGEDEFLRVWDVASGRLLRKVPCPRWNALGLARSPDGMALAVGQEVPPRLTVWSQPLSKEILSLPWGNTPPRCLAFSPDGRTLAADEDEALHLIDLVSGRRRLPPLQHDRATAIRHAAFSPDGKLVATSQHPRGPVRFWETATGRERSRLPTEDHVFAFSPDGRILASVGDQRDVTLWDTATATRQTSLPLAPARPVRRGAPCLAYSADGKMLAASNDGSEAVVWALDGRRVLARFQVGGATRLLFTPDGKTLVTWTQGPMQGAFRLWDVATGKERHGRAGHTGVVNALGIAADGKVIASGSSEDETVRLWETATGRPLRILGGHESHPWLIQFGPAGNAVLVGGQSRTGGASLRLYGTRTGKQLRNFLSKPLQDGLRICWAACLSADGKRVAAVFEDAGLGANSAEKHTLFACQTATGRELVRRPLPTGRVRFAFSRDAKRLAIIRAGTIRIEEVQTGKARQWSTPADPTGRPVFSADGNLLALNRAAPEGEPAAVVVWDVAEGRPQLTLASGRAGFLAFSPDSRYLATAGMDALRLWELASGREVLCRPRPESYHGYHGPSFASSLAFTPDGRSVATGLLDTTVLLWGLAPDAAAAPADLRRLWQALSGEAPRAYTALWALARAPRDQVLALLRQELSPAPRPDAERVRRLLADLGSERFAVRQAATRELQAMGEAIRPALRRELEGNPPLEVRQRIAKLLDVPATLSSGKALRAVRAVEVLERLAAPEARRLLERLAGGAPAARLTREARAALARLARSPQ